MNVGTPDTWTNGVRVGDGRVIMCPVNADYVWIFHPQTDTFSEVSTGTLTVDNKFLDTVITSDGQVVCFGNAYVGVFNPDTDTFSWISIGSGYSFVGMGGVATDDGRVVFSPYGTTTILRWYRRSDRMTARCDRPNFSEFSYKFPKIFIARENSASKSRFFTRPRSEPLALGVRLP